MHRLAPFLVLILSGCIKAVPPTLEPESIVPYTTSDGWEGQIRHYPGEGEPVLLVHGMGANHYNWDYREEVSLSHYLQARGWDVWVPELRGDPGSAPPEKKARGRFTFDDHATRDLPAIVDAVLAVTGEEELYWVGHSMGGMLLYTALAQYPDKVASGVAISSPSTFSGSLPSHRLAKHAGWAVGGNGRIPARGLAHLTLPLGRANPLYGRLANRKNLDWPVAKGLARHALVDLPKPMARQAVQWMRDGDLTRIGGESWVEPDATPLLVMGGVKDRVVAEPDVAATCDHYENCEYIELSVANGFAYDYGHIDPVIGKSADDEIYPLVADWLDAQLQATAPSTKDDGASQAP